MKLDTSKIREGHMIGETVWVCSYHRPDLNKKALRNVPPTKCIVTSIDDTKKTVYYSKTYFAPIGKNGEATKKVISPVDNTGYRMHCGNEIDVFDNEYECNSLWNNQVLFVVEKLRENAKSAEKMLTNEANNIASLMV